MLHKLPTDILDNVITFCSTKQIVNLVQVDRETFRIYQKRTSVWKSLWNRIVLEENRKKKGSVPTNLNGNFMQLVFLFTNCGCNICGKKRIRKVYWCFRARICKECAIEYTISDYRLEQMQIPRDLWFHLPSYEREMYGRYVGHYTLTFYWKESIPGLNSLVAEVEEKERVLEEHRKVARIAMEKHNEELQQKKQERQTRYADKQVAICNDLDPSQQDPDILMECPSYVRCFKSKTEWSRSRKKHWIDLITDEYQEACVEHRRKKQEIARLAISAHHFYQEPKVVVKRKKKKIQERIPEDRSKYVVRPENGVRIDIPESAKSNKGVIPDDILRQIRNLRHCLHCSKTFGSCMSLYHHSMDYRKHRGELFCC